MRLLSCEVFPRARMGLSDILNIRPARKVEYVDLRNWMLAVKELAGDGLW